MGAVKTIMDALKVAIPDFARSNGSIEAKIIDVVGSYADAEAIERQATLDIIANALANQRITGKDYYRRRAVAWQPDDELLFDGITFLPYYENPDTSKQPVKQAYMTGVFPYYTLLINLIDGDTKRMRKATNQELRSFSTYFEAFQPIGMHINIYSTDPAQITDNGLIIYIKPGVSATAAVAAINANILAYESEFRQNNTVSLSEMENVIQRYAGVNAVSWGEPRVRQQQLDGSITLDPPVDGIFDLVNGAYSFRTEVILDMIKTLE